MTFDATWRDAMEGVMIPDEDLIVDISKEREKFFGCSGRMLIPCAATVEALVAEVARNRLLTTNGLRDELASRHGVQAVCPAATNTALRLISRDGTRTVAYWRVIKANGELVGSFPGGVGGHADMLRQEGFTIDESGKAPKVARFKESLVTFDSDAANGR
jgi:hypothetical protein